MGGAEGPALRATPWRNAAGEPVHAPEPPPAGSYYGPVGDFQGAHYERNAFTMGTEQEVALLWEVLELRSGHRVVDVGCGTGRHARALVTRGAEVLGVDLSAGLLRAAGELGGPGRWVQADARALPLAAGCADAVICLCQGGFGITPGGDRAVLAELARVLRPGGRLALTAFSLAFAARHLAPEDAIDLRRGLVHSPAEVRGPDGTRRTFDLWTSCYTPAHLADLLEQTGLAVVGLWGAEPGRYTTAPPALDDPEILALAAKR